MDFFAGGALQCSNCGFENPSIHRYCGMCGTPFPHRAAAAAPVAAAPVAAAPVAVPAAEVVRAESVAKITAAEMAAAEVLAVQPVNAAVGPAEEVFATDEVSEEPLVEAPAEEPAKEETAEEVEAKAEAEHEAAVTAAEEVLVAEPVNAALSPVEEVFAMDAASEEAAVETVEPEAPAPTPVVKETVRPPAPVVAVPARPFLVHPPQEERKPAKPIEIKPTPETLPYEMPPASSGMPTFQDVQEMAGPPPISPFEPQTTKPEDEDKELQEYIASFKYTPPVETAGELTMRSEVPDLDEAEPQPFHHPSFDNDEAPPPEAGPHPTGEEYYKDGHTVERAHFLDVPVAADEPGGAYPAILAAETAQPSTGRRWPWVALAALVALFVGLGFWEGRAVNASGTSGPVAYMHRAYESVRQKLHDMQTAAPAPTTASESPKAEPEKPKEVAAEKPASEPVSTPAATQEEPKPATQPEATQETAAKTPSEEVKTPVVPKNIQAPPAPKSSGKSQPGQAEFDKALTASDPTAAAAWLWKATSRGNPDAPVRLADFYIKGTGVPKSCEQAMVLLRSAATKENAAARDRLASLYANGTCVARDRVKAYQLMTSALQVDPNNDWAKESREVLLQQMTPQERAAVQKSN